MKMTGRMKDYYDNVILLTGITGLFTALPALHFYRSDVFRREYGRLIKSPPGQTLKFWESLLLLLMGAGFALYGNLFVGSIAVFFDATSYQESMELITNQKGLLMMIWWMGVVAPFAEEVIFRWLIYLRLRDSMKIGRAAVISGLIFGVYHGNIVQAIYATLLGIMFAYILEMSGNLWSSVLLHIGANIWALILSEYAEKMMKESQMPIIMGIFALLFLIMIHGTKYFRRRGKERGYRAV